MTLVSLCVCNLKHMNAWETEAKSSHLRTFRHVEIGLDPWDERGKLSHCLCLRHLVATIILEFLLHLL